MRTIDEMRADDSLCIEDSDGRLHCTEYADSVAEDRRALLAVISAIPEYLLDPTDSHYCQPLAQAMASITATRR